VLDDVEAHHGVEAVLGGGEGRRVRHVGVGDPQIRAPLAQPLEGVEVERIDVARDVLTPWNEGLGEVADARPDLQHPLAHVRPDGVGHPLVEGVGPREAREDLRAVLVVDVHVIGEREAADRRERLEAVPPIDLLALLVGAPRVADGHLEDPHLPLGELDGELGLDPEVVRHQGDRLEEPGAHGLVASLHIGEVQVRHRVAEEGEELVAQLVPVQQHPARAAAREA
jgi:hypothetical protein